MGRFVVLCYRSNDGSQDLNQRINLKYERKIRALDRAIASRLTDQLLQ